MSGYGRIPSGTAYPTNATYSGTGATNAPTSSGAEGTSDGLGRYAYPPGFSRRGQDAQTALSQLREYGLPPRAPRTYSRIGTAGASPSTGTVVPSGIRGDVTRLAADMSQTRSGAQQLSAAANTTALGAAALNEWAADLEARMTQFEGAVYRAAAAESEHGKHMSDLNNALDRL